MTGMTTCHSYGPSSSAYNASASYPTPDPTPLDRTLVLVAQVKIGTKIKWTPAGVNWSRPDPFVGKVTAIGHDKITVQWDGSGPGVFSVDGLAERVNTGEAVIVAD